MASAAPAGLPFCLLGSPFWQSRRLASILLAWLPLCLLSFHVACVLFSLDLLDGRLRVRLPACHFWPSRMLASIVLAWLPFCLVGLRCSRSVSSLLSWLPLCFLGFPVRPLRSLGIHFASVALIALASLLFSYRRGSWLPLRVLGFHRACLAFIVLAWLSLLTFTEVGLPCARLATFLPHGGWLPFGLRSFHLRPSQELASILLARLRSVLRGFHL